MKPEWAADRGMMMSGSEREGEVRRFQGWLMRERIGSFGPETGMLLARIQEEVSRKLPAIEDPDVKRRAERYETALREVCVVGALHMAAVIEGLSGLVHAMQRAESD